MCLFGTTLFSDKSGISVHWKYLPLLRDFSQIHKFSWGSACLAHMYRSLCRALRYDCKDMDGPLALLLVWAWIRMPTIGPLPVDTSFPLARRWNDYQPTTEHYKNWTTSDVRRRLDDLPLDGFVWDAYSPNRVALQVIPFDINNGANFWSAIVPLICFEAVEWHPTDRIRRQFGFHQDPPVEAMKLGASHNIVLTCPKNKNWGIEHAVWISQWLNSSMCVLTGEHVDNYQPSDQYIDWYIGKFGDHLRVSELAEHEEEGQQEQPHQQEQQTQQEQPPQQQGPPQQ
ncbi:serine/threonine-protein phosphatase 7 long form homolog [Arachis hypogaea]|uniref:serine/threonine-protein phosphatase 7 long form homolog n=1 Tax=Arachis hypogaea TaxID=3818 RepID=UPI003B2156CA